MTISINSAAGKAALNTANPTQLADLIRAMNFGDFVRSMPIQLVGQVPAAAAADPYVNASAISIPLPDDAKAAYLLRGYGRVGTATAGPLTCDAADQTGAAQNPSTLHLGVSANGDLVMHGADAWTLVDVLYLPAQYNVVEVTLPVVSGTLTLPTTYGEVLFLLEVEATTPTDSKLIVDFPTSGAPATLHAALNLAKTAVSFNTSTDAWTNARVKFAAQHAPDLNAFLETAQNFF